jgi:pimeloyl-ACP methyl ester carboxylesterase
MRPKGRSGNRPHGCASRWTPAAGAFSIRPPDMGAVGGRSKRETPSMIRELAAAAALSVLVSGPAAHAQTTKDAPAPAAAADQPQDATVAVEAGGGSDALLYGSYLRPVGGGSYPAVLILPAQGSDRNGNSSTAEGPKPDTYRLLARDLAAKGVASLRIDKRGVGASAKAILREEDLRFDTYVDDAVTWTRFLKAQPKVNCMAILGHSESALVAALATKKIKVCALIEVAGAGRPAAAMLAAQLKTAVDTKGMDQPLYDQATKILNTLANGKTVADPPEKLNALFRPSVQPYLISWLDLNPIEALKTAPPTLVLQGASDLQSSPEDAQRLAAAPKLAKLVMVAGADHDLKLRPLNKTKADPDTGYPVAPQASTAIADFLKRLKWP